MPETFYRDTPEYRQAQIERLKAVEADLERRMKRNLLGGAALIVLAVGLAAGRLMGWW